MALEKKDQPYHRVLRLPHINQVTVIPNILHEGKAYKGSIINKSVKVLSNNDLDLELLPLNKISATPNRQDYCITCLPGKSSPLNTPKATSQPWLVKIIINHQLYVKTVLRLHFGLLSWTSSSIMELHYIYIEENNNGPSTENSDAETSQPTEDSSLEDLSRQQNENHERDQQIQTLTMAVEGR